MIITANYNILNLVQPLPVHWHPPSLALAPDDRTGIVSNFSSNLHPPGTSSAFRIPKKVPYFFTFFLFTRHSKISDSFYCARAQQLSAASLNKLFGLLLLFF
jgi:hypothetical protein